MDSGLYVLLGIIVPLVRVGFYMMSQNDANRRDATLEHNEEEDDPELERLIREKEEGGSTEDNPGGAGPYRVQVRGHDGSRRAPAGRSETRSWRAVPAAICG